MKKVFLYVVVAGFAAITACGPSAEEKAAKEKATQDSVAAATQKAMNDSIAEATAKAAQAEADSLAKAAEAAKADSVAKAEAAAKAKPAKPAKPTKKPVSTVKVNGPDTRAVETKKADDKTKSGFDRFKKK